MKSPEVPTTRRNFLKATTQVAAVSALASTAVPCVHAGEENTIQIALVGCGGRGTGATSNALSTKNGPIKLVAMADVFESKMSTSFDNLQKKFSAQMEVPHERKFLGFDAYQKAMDCLKPGDIVLLTTPPAFRWVHFGYAIKKGLNVFMEKPITVDGPTTRKLFDLATESVRKNLKVGVGLMCRHCAARGELFDRIKNDQIGKIVTLKAYRQVGGGGMIGPKPEGISELMYQIRRFHGFLWASGGVLMDFLIHNIDECCWMKDAWPIKAQGSGARCYREDKIDQNFDNYAIEYTFPDGTDLQVYARTMPGCRQEFASYALGSKGSAVISTSSHTPAKCRIFRGYNMARSDLTWAYPQPEKNPYQLEWDHLIDAIRSDRPYNEARRGAEASLVTSMGRMAAHTGQLVTWSDILGHTHEFAPTVELLTLNGEAPLKVGAAGHYPYPQPGVVRDREF
jgi:predicted dehydrogenase